MEQVAILGGNSLVGQHLIGALSAVSTIKLINVWTFSEKFKYRLSDNNNLDDSRLLEFCGLKALEMAIQDCDTVFNLHELQDFSLVPDKRRLKEQNVDFVSTLLEMSKRAQVKRLVHLSSIYLQCSRLWPNIGSREVEFKKFEKEVPYTAYCQSKNEAEQMLLKSSDIQKVVARVGPLYGEGDRSSVICDAIYWSKFSNTLPIVGDRDGALQMNYAGNVAEAISHFAKKMVVDPAIDNEIVLVQDDTPTKSIYESTLKHFYTNRTRRISNIPIPFYLVFAIYLLFSMAGRIASAVFGDLVRFEQFPTPTYLYFAFRHWTFFSGFKQRIFFDFVPKFSYEEAIHRSRAYYKKLSPEDVSAFSWYINPM